MHSFHLMLLQDFHNFFLENNDFRSGIVQGSNFEREIVKCSASLS